MCIRGMFVFSVLRSHVCCVVVVFSLLCVPVCVFLVVFSLLCVHCCLLIVFLFWPPTRGRCQPVRHRRSGPCIEFGEFACISPGRLLPMCDPVTKYNGTQPGASRSHPETGRGQLPIRPLTMEMENPRPWISVPATTRQWTSPRTRYGWPAPNLAGKHQMALFLSPKARRPRGDERAAIPPAFLGRGPSGYRCLCSRRVLVVVFSLLCFPSCVLLVPLSLLCSRCCVVPVAVFYPLLTLPPFLRF